MSRAPRHDLNVFLNFSESIFTPKEWFLSKKGPKEGERVARGHFHERVGETPIHWLPPALELPKNLFPFPRTGHLKISFGPTQFYIVNFTVCYCSYFIPISTMAPNSSETSLSPCRLNLIFNLEKNIGLSCYAYAFFVVFASNE